MRWIRLSRRAQVSALALGLAAFGWVAHTTLRTVAHEPLLSGRDDRIRALEAEIAARDQQNEYQLAEIASLRVARDSALAARVVLEKEVTLRSRERDEARAATEELYAERDRATAGQAQASGETDSLSRELAAAYIERWRVEESLQVAEDRLAAMERNVVVSREGQALAERKATTLKDRVASLELVQGELVERLMPVTSNELTRLETYLGTIGIDLERVVATAEPGAGGPLVELRDLQPPKNGEPAENQDKLLRLATGIVRLDSLKAALPEMPLATPLQTYELRSTFGSRRDPFNRRLAFHAGLDFAGPIGTPISVTAPGEVIFAGWEGAYGRSVKVQHAFGIVTRYAHMREISVKVGDKLETGDTVGQLGSSGRSTGPHLHYEVLFDDVPRDPLRFIEAGRHVREQVKDRDGAK